MRRSLFILMFLLVGRLLPAQNDHLGFQLGFGSSYDYGIDLPEMPGFKPYGKGRTSAFTVDAFVGIPIGRLVLYPSYMFSIPMRTMTIENLRGDYIPQGYGISLPYSEQNPNVIYGENYYDLSATAEIWQSKLGAFALYHLGGGLEIGGLFRGKPRFIPPRRCASTNIGTAAPPEPKPNQTATAAHTPTISKPTNSSTTTWPCPSVKLQWRYQGGSFYTGTSIIRWVGGGDGFWSFRYTTGFHF